MPDALLLLSFFSSSLLLRSQCRPSLLPRRSKPPDASISAPLQPRSPEDHFSLAFAVINQNASTSQQQPLPSPDPDAADDTLVTPADTTAHPAGTPPGDSTLNRVDDQSRRFDFGPF
ncbi:hypothetical protein JCGZ_11119 [Jatropha curcas]|uniref:Uncharacterized protein n=1 Tax=Jatropha curcas TaxID=180498 RepID=A0A067KRW2_JATCU|nr:hypothetical protein JCGZ_11119 [Jatropha curcas]